MVANRARTAHGLNGGVGGEDPQVSVRDGRKLHTRRNTQRLVLVTSAVARQRTQAVSPRLLARTIGASEQASPTARSSDVKECGCLSHLGLDRLEEVAGDTQSSVGAVVALGEAHRGAIGATWHAQGEEKLVSVRTKERARACRCCGEDGAG